MQLEAELAAAKAEIAKLRADGGVDDEFASADEEEDAIAGHEFALHGYQKDFLGADTGMPAPTVRDSNRDSNAHHLPSLVDAAGAPSLQAIVGRALAEPAVYKAIFGEMQCIHCNRLAPRRPLWLRACWCTIGVPDHRCVRDAPTASSRPSGSRAARARRCRTRCRSLRRGWSS